MRTFAAGRPVPLTDRSWEAVVSEDRVSAVVFERQYRTPYSEGYHVRRHGQRIAHLDLHFTHGSVYATLVLEEEMSEDDVLSLIERVDNSLVLSAEVERGDFLVTVFHGRETGFYTDDYLGERRERRSGEV